MSLYFLRTLSAITLLSLGSLLFMSALWGEAPSWSYALANSGVLTALMAPVLYFWVLKPCQLKFQQENTHQWYHFNHDLLTHLPNRYLLFDRAIQARALGRRQGTESLLVAVDLDHFKTVNDIYGYDLGNEVLKHWAFRVEACLRSTDTLARTGGDEFCILLTHLPHADAAKRVLQAIVEASQKPFFLHDHSIEISVSLGVMPITDDLTSTEQLLRKAELALQAVKDSGRNGYRYYEASLEARWS